jgi:putative ABC transport system permease protein
VEDFKIMTQEEILKTVSIVMGVLTFFVGGVAAISLLVGGIGIMNIMLVSVTERTREIGIRKAVGATQGDIFVQFLVEAVTLSFSGGLVGMILGIIFSLLMTRLAGLDATVTVWAIVVGTLFSLVVGVVSGLYPAMRAARLDPIEALRYE